MIVNYNNYIHYSSIRYAYMKVHLKYVDVLILYVKILAYIKQYKLAVSILVYLLMIWLEYECWLLIKVVSYSKKVRDKVIPPILTQYCGHRFIERDRGERLWL